VSSRDALAPQSGVGQTPRLAWDAPDLGDTGLYDVFVYSVHNYNGATTFPSIASFRVRGRYVDMPEGLLQAGTTYTATIVALHLPSFDWTRPLRLGFPIARASVVLAPFTP